MKNNELTQLQLVTFLNERRRWLESSNHRDQSWDARRRRSAQARETANILDAITAHKLGIRPIESH